MSNSDIEEWKKSRKYGDNNIPCWLTEASDIEDSFCVSQHVALAFGISEEDAAILIDEAVALLDPTRVEREFTTALAGATVSLPKEVRSIPGKRWRDLGEVCANTIKGKELLSKIRAAALLRYQNPPEALKLSGLNKLSQHCGFELCPSLREMLETALSSSETVPAAGR